MKDAGEQTFIWVRDTSGKSYVNPRLDGVPLCRRRFPGSIWYHIICIEWCLSSIKYSFRGHTVGFISSGFDLLTTTHYNILLSRKEWWPNKIGIFVHAPQWYPLSRNLFNLKSTHCRVIDITEFKITHILCIYWTFEKPASVGNAYFANLQHHQGLGPVSRCKKKRMPDASTTFTGNQMKCFHEWLNDLHRLFGSLASDSVLSMTKLSGVISGAMTILMDSLSNHIV